MERRSKHILAFLAIVLFMAGIAKLVFRSPPGQWVPGSMPKPVRSIAGVAFPGGVAVDRAGFVYVSDTHNNKIVKFDAKGVPLAAWGNKGKDPGNLDYPQGLAFADHDVYVADVHNHRIQVFSDTGDLVSTWGEFGTAPGQFQNPYSIAVATNGDVYVVDNGNNRVQVFTHDGSFKKEFGSMGADDGQFTRPQGIALDSHGNLYVGDGGNNRIEKFTGDGDFLASWPCLNHDVALDAGGHVFVVSGNHVKVFSDDGKFITQWGGKGKALGQFDFAARVAVDRLGSKIYVTDANNNRVQIFKE